MVVGLSVELLLSLYYLSSDNQSVEFAHHIWYVPCSPILTTPLKIRYLLLLYLMAIILFSHMNIYITEPLSCCTYYYYCILLLDPVSSPLTTCMYVINKFSERIYLHNDTYYLLLPPFTKKSSVCVVGARYSPFRKSYYYGCIVRIME